MSIMNCPRCSDSFDSDQHTEPLCKTCMGKIETQCICPSIPDRRHDWIATFDDYDGADDAGPMFRLMGSGRTEDEAIENLVRAI